MKIILVEEHQNVKNNFFLFNKIVPLGEEIKGIQC